MSTLTLPQSQVFEERREEDYECMIEALRKDPRATVANAEFLHYEFWGAMRVVDALDLRTPTALDLRDQERVEDWRRKRAALNSSEPPASFDEQRRTDRLMGVATVCLILAACFGAGLGLSVLCIWCSGR